MRTLLRFLLVFFAVVAAASGLACNSSDDATGALLPEDVSGGVYVALGDSVAAGSGASDPETTSYVALVGAALREGDVRLVTITIGGNDLNELQSSPDTRACLADVRSPACPVAELLVGTEERLDTILGELRAAGPETAIVMELYPNLFSGTGHIFEGPADDAFAMLNEVIARVTERYDIVLADPRAPFVGGGRELTRLLDATPDAHPNDAGHRAIAEAFLEAVGLQD